MRYFLDDVRDRWLDDVTVRRRLIAGLVVIGLIAAFAWWQVRSDPATISSSAASSSNAESGITADASDTAESSSQAASSRIPNAPAVASSAASSVPSSVPSTVTTVAGGTGTEPAAGAPSSAPGAGSSSAPYPTSPDGTPLPLVTVFDTDTITISGQVPSEAARERLIGLATANSQFPDARVVDNMVVNPAVPISVGVRVIELNSARFPEGSAEILPDHARELDRVVNIMNALPNLSVLVVGHADQRGDEVTNFAVSDQRARAVLNYLIYLGISPSRLSSRAAGESDLLAVGDDEASLALNRRTEFIFGGLLVE